MSEKGWFWERLPGEGHLQHHDVTYDPEELLSSGGTMSLSLPWGPIFSLSHHLLRPSGGHLQAEFGVQVLECPSNEGLTAIWGFSNTLEGLTDTWAQPDWWIQGLDMISTA